MSLLFWQGINWADEIFQTLEPAHHLITGKGIIAWEFEEKLRSMLYPLLLSILLKCIYFFSNSALVSYIIIRVILMIPFLIMLFIVYKSFIKDNKKDIVYKGLFFLFFTCLPIYYYFGFRTLTESITTSFAISCIFILTFYLSYLNKYHLLIIGFIIGLSYGIRFQTALIFIVFIPLFLYQIRKDTNFKSIITFLFLGGLFGFFLYLLSDFYFYDIPFISTINYFVQNIIEDVASKHGVEPLSFYFIVLLFNFQLFLIFFLIGIIIYFKKFYPIILSFIFYIIIHSSIAHKEIRFLYITFPIFSFFIIKGILYVYTILHKKKVIFSYIFLLVVVFSFLKLQYNLVKTNIWNIRDVQLQSFLKVSHPKTKLDGNVLLSHKHASKFWSAGYVSLGISYKHTIFFQKLQTLPIVESKNYIKKNQIKYILTELKDKAYYCENFNFCKELIIISSKKDSDIKAVDMVWLY